MDKDIYIKNILQYSSIGHSRLLKIFNKTVYCRIKRQVFIFGMWFNKNEL